MVRAISFIGNLNICISVYAHSTGETNTWENLIFACAVPSAWKIPPCFLSGNLPAVTHTPAIHKALALPHFS